MILYWVLFGVQALGSLLNRYGTGERWRLGFISLVAVPSLAMIGLRWGIGPDFLAYWDIFRRTQSITLWQAVSHSDPGYYFLMWLLHATSAPFLMANVICAAIFIFGLTKFSLRQPNPWLAFLVLFPYLVIVLGMSGNRQSAAIGFLLIALIALEDGKLLKFLVLSFIGALFHASAVVMIPIGLLSVSRNRLESTLLLVVAAVLAVYTFHDTVGVLVARYSSQQIQSQGTIYRLAMAGLAAVILLLSRERLELGPAQWKLWRNIALCSLASVPAAILAPSSTAIDRYLLYLFPLQAVVYSRLPLAFSSKEQEAGLITFAIIGYAGIVQAIFLVFGNFASGYVPYESIFTNTHAHRVAPYRL